MAEELLKSCDFDFEGYSGWIGDKGYVGREMITPHKKPPTAD